MVPGDYTGALETPRGGDGVLRISLKLRFGTMRSFSRLAFAAEELGLDGVWLSEPWGYDATSLLGWLSAKTSRVLIGTHVLSVYSRTPAAFAGLAASLQVASDGRFRLGLGTSGPQVVEGWHGVPFERPVDLTADIVAIVRQALRGEVVEHSGRAVTLPRPGGPGKALPFAGLREPITVPIYLAAAGDRNLRLTANTADGWIPFPWSPESASTYGGVLEAALADRDQALAPLAIAPSGSVAFGDVAELRDLERTTIAFYLGAMGTGEQNFYVSAVARMGFGEQARQVQERWRSGDRAGAREAIPDELIDQVTLFGGADTVRARLDEYRRAGVDELVVDLRRRDTESQLADLRRLVELL